MWPISRWARNSRPRHPKEDTRSAHRIRTFALPIGPPVEHGSDESGLMVPVVRSNPIPTTTCRGVPLLRLLAYSFCAVRKPRMNHIFVNYRTGDETYAALLLDEKLCERFGRRNVFRDNRSIGLGLDFKPV